MPDLRRILLIEDDPDIAAAWRASGIEATQIGGVWVYARVDAATGRAAIGPLVRAWARELTRIGS